MPRKQPAQPRAAVKKYTNYFDGVSIENFVVTPSEIENAVTQIPSNLKNAIQVAADNISKFHSSQKEIPTKIETTSGVFCWRESRAIDTIGIYIPGGTAPLFSTVLMLAIPAKLAGCKNIILCSPPDKNGNINPAILYAAQLTGVTQMYKVGGIQAIAALTFGTDEIPAKSNDSEENEENVEGEATLKDAPNAQPKMNHFFRLCHQMTLFNG